MYIDVEQLDILPSAIPENLLEILPLNLWKSMNEKQRVSIENDRQSNGDDKMERKK